MTRVHYRLLCGGTVLTEGTTEFPPELNDDLYFGETPYRVAGRVWQWKQPSYSSGVATEPFMMLDLLLVATC
jgi:hypothetical protein